MPRALITGINGQDGSYLADFLLDRGYQVTGLMRDGGEDHRHRIIHLQDRVDLVTGSLLDEAFLRGLIEKHQPDEVYNFAARASSSQLFLDPVLTGDFNGLAVVRMLEAIRTVNPAIRFCQASSSEMFGDASEAPQRESTSFRPRNPYGVAKLFAHGMVGTYRDNFGAFACSAILYNHESPRRGPEFVTRKISMGVARIRRAHAQSLQLGSLDAERDWGYAADYVRAMWKMLQMPAPGDYVLATGESHSVREFCEVAFDHVGLDYHDFVLVDARARRPREAVPLVGDASKAKAVLEWAPTVSFDQLVRMMVDADVARLIKESEIQVR